MFMNFDPDNTLKNSVLAILGVGFAIGFILGYIAAVIVRIVTG